MSGTDEAPAPGASGRHGLAELIAERRAKGERLKETDGESFPYVFKGAEPIADRAYLLRSSRR